MVTHGVWSIYTEARVAFNCHNGAPVYWNEDGTRFFAVAVPAEYMLRQLGEWVLTHYGIQQTSGVTASMA